MYIYLASVLSVPAAEMKPFLGTELLKYLEVGTEAKAGKVAV